LRQAQPAIARSGFPAVTTNEPNRVAASLQSHPNLVYFVHVPLLAAALRVVCALDHLHYAEHLVLVAYTKGMHVLWNTLVIVPGWYLICSCLLIALLASDAHASPRGAI
jgi:hypothetical protein